MAPANDILGVAACDRTSPATLVFEQLAFAYPSRNEDVPDRPVLRNVSLWIEPGETAALVGSSGAGKTTTASLLARFLEPSKGRILWGNQSIDGMPLAHWRNHLAIVHQEDWLLAATVRENMALGREDVSEQDIFEALDISCARALVEALPDQLDTLIGERGHDLSGGERQRLCLARALIGRPQLLILDEATAALDLKTEHIIFQNLSRLSWRPTVLLISHRLTAIAAAQTIHVLDEGRIVESGTHEELLATGRYYAEMLQLQQNREVEA
jgi:ABC-type multidrug transport system fused ATPase/permease subunit